MFYNITVFLFYLDYQINAALMRVKFFLDLINPKQYLNH